MAETNEPRALGAALAGPAFATRGAGLAMHVADRHVERWAPEAGAGRVRPLRSLGFVDRMIAPWVETAQRSASLRLFNQYAQGGFPERPPGGVSWVFPRPWYQDELDWMAAARRVPQQQAPAPTLFTTRATYVPPQQQAAQAARPSAMALPSALYEYVAPSMSIAQPAAVAGVGYGGESVHADAYSPLIPLAAVQAAQLMARTVAPAAAGTRMTPALRAVLSAMIERAAAPTQAEPMRLAQLAPELVTPPAPRLPDSEVAAATAAAAAVTAAATATATPTVAAERPEARSAPRAAAAEQLAEHYAAQRAQVAELQRIAQRNAEREIAARAAAVAAAAAAAATASASSSASASASTPASAAAASLSPSSSASQAPAITAPSAERAAELRETARQVEAQLREAAAGAPTAAAAEEQRRRIETARVTERARIEAERTRIEAERATERARIEARVTERTAERASAQRLHEQARTAAAEHARAAAAAATATATSSTTPSAEAERSAATRRPPPEVTAAIAALPPELAAFIGQRPERAMKAIEELDVAFRTIELIARGAARGASFQATRGPRLVMPAGLGGLVAAVDRTAGWAGGRVAGDPQASIAALGAAPAAAGRPSIERADASAPGAATRGRPFAPALAAATRVPTLPWLAAESARPIGAVAAMPGAALMPGAAPRRAGAGPMGALAAVASAPPATLSHVAWADRWLARFAGASKASLDALAAPSRMEALAAAAPGGVFVSPTFDIERDAGPARNVDRLLAAAERRPTLIPPPAPVIRYADDAETPDDVFMAISAAAARQRTQPAAPSSSAAPSTSSTPGAWRADASALTSASASTAAFGSTAAFASPAAFAPAASARAGATASTASTIVVVADRAPADVIAATAPAAPTAGLAAQLAASPFAPALRHIVPMPSGTTFDVRSLFSGGLAATYLAGLLSAESHELELAPRALPSWAAPGLESFAGDVVAEREVPGWDATYVAPSEVDAEASIASAAEAAASFAAAREAAASSFAATRGDAAAAAAAAAAASFAATRGDAAAAAARGDEAAAASFAALRGDEAAAASFAALRGDEAAAASFAALRGDEAAALRGDAVTESFAATRGDAAAAMEPAALAAAERAAQAMASAAPITTLRSALLSWSADASPFAGGAPGVFGWVGVDTEAMGSASAAAPGVTGLPVSTARAMLESMSLPMLGDVIGSEDRGGAWMAPGMVASSAHSWSVAQERSASDLALDFVTPELVLAARVYGLGPSEAAQAARLALAGSGHLTAMAGTVDRAFIQAMAIDATRRERLAALMTAYPVSTADGELAAAAATGAAAAATGAAAARVEAARVQATRGEPSRIEPARGEAARGEAAHVETPAEAARAEAARIELSYIEAARIDAARIEASRGEAARGELARTAFASASALAEQVPGGTAFGIDRRPPRGAFLWPSASVAALGLSAAVPEGEAAMSVAALELLAARTVAELGTYAAFDVPRFDEIGGAAGGAAGVGAFSGAAAGDVAGVSGALAGVGGASGALDAAALSAAGSAGGAGTSGAAAGSAEAAAAAASAASAASAAGFAATGGGLVQRYPFLPGARRFEGGAAAGLAPGALGEPEERDVLVAASGLVPASRRARFEALYLALGQSTAGRSWSPAARAARALALAGRTDDVPLSARERATSAWDVLPVVYASEGLLDTATGAISDGATASSDGAAAGSLPFAAGSLPFAAGARGPTAPGGRELRAADASTSDWVGGYAGAGLGALSARAGEALGAYVAPMALPAPRSASSSSSSEPGSSREREVGAVLRAPTAMQELVRTGRPAGRHGGGETEIPPWFEAAARKMFESQGTIADGISISELTLVTAAPSTQIAASTRTAPSAGPAAPSASTAAEKHGGSAKSIDVETTAQEIYRYILTMMDAARARNGEPYL